ncbi:hypothetical protein D3C86_1053380 [compost metagenome]
MGLLGKHGAEMGDRLGVLAGGREQLRKGEQHLGARGGLGQLLFALHEREALLEAMEGLLVREAAQGLLTGAKQVIDGLGDDLTQQEVARQDLGALLAARAQLLLERLAHLAVQLLALGKQQGIVDRLMGQRLIELPLARRAPVQELGGFQGFERQGIRLLLGELGDQGGLEVAAHDRGQLQHRAHRRPQPVEARPDDAADRARQLACGRARNLPGVALVAHEHAGILERSHQFPQEQGIALAPREDLLAELAHVFGPARGLVRHREHARHQRPALGLAQRAQHEGPGLDRRAPPVKRIALDRARLAQHQKPALLEVAGRERVEQTLEPFERGLVGPVQVLEVEEQGAIARIPEQQGIEGLEGHGPALLRGQLRELGALRADPEQVRDGEDRALSLLAGGGLEDLHALAQARPDLVGRLVPLDAEPAPDEVAQEGVGRPLLVRNGANPLGVNLAGRVQSGDQGARQQGLADARLAGEHDQVRRPLGGAREGRFEGRKLSLPAHHGDGLDARGGPGLRADQLVDRDRLRPALDLHRLEGGEVHGVARMAIGLVRDQDLPRPRGPFHLLSEVDRLAHDRVVALLGAADRAGDDQAGMDPDADLEDDARVRLQLLGELARRPLHLACGADRPLRIVLVRDGGPEEGHDRVPDVLVDHPAKAVDGLGEHLEEAVDDLGDGFGVELLAHGGETGDVGEKHRHLPAIPCRFRAGFGQASRRLALAQLANAALGAEVRMGGQGVLTGVTVHGGLGVRSGSRRLVEASV